MNGPSNKQKFGGLPIATPFVEGTKIPQPWTQALQKLDTFVTDAHKDSTTVVSNEDPEQTLKYVRMGSTLLYEYTGVGGVSFNVRGNLVSIPTSTTSQTTRSFCFAGEQ
jgi:hypothetical protein